MSEHLEPKLAPPGAGLPKIELYIARRLFGMRLWTGGRDSFNARFRRERDAIRALLAHDPDPQLASQRVLIKRLPGLEDSSRCWSVWMTLDHLRIVNGQIVKVIGALAKEVAPEGKASTAAVKPNPSADDSVAVEYERSCDALLAVVAAAPNLKTKALFAHPWFGSLDAFGWHAMAGGHMGIHRAQIERILAALRAPA